MADGTAIEWTQRPGTKGASWNPVRARSRFTGKVGWHCTHASEGCRFCYAESFNRRLGTGLPYKPGLERDIEIFLDEKALAEPLRWREPRTIFCGSMTDLFAPFVDDIMLERIFAVPALCPQHTFIFLTKRGDRMRRHLTRPGAETSPLRVVRRKLESVGVGAPGALDRFGRHVAKHGLPVYTWPLPNVWLGVSAEDQQTADERVPELLQTPSAVHFVSAEPLLAALDFTKIKMPLGGGSYIGFNALRAGSFDQWSGARLDWIIVGGESGRDARPMHSAWARSIRDQCEAAGVPFFFKQWGEWGRAAPRPSETPGNFALESAAPHSDFWPAMVTPVDHYPRAINLFGGASVRERVGKKRAGRMLDGVEHSEFPKVSA